MNRNLLASLLFPALAAILPTGCGNVPTGAAPVTDLGDYQATRTYRIEGDRLIYAIPADTLTSCSGSTLVETPRPLRYDTNIIELSGDTLRLLGDTFTNGPVTAVEVNRLVRAGSGSGVEGTWKYVWTDSRILSGAYDSAASASRARLRAYNDGIRSIFTIHFVIGAGEIQSWYKGESSAIFIYNWNTPSSRSYADSQAYAISLRAVDARTVEMKGLVSGEVVTHRAPAPRDDGTTFSSSDPAHVPSVHYVHPRACPFEQQPVWYDAFLKANRK